MSNNTSLYGTGSLIPAGDNVIITGTLTVNGCAILTDCTTFNLLPFNANTLNIGGESTTLALGATTGVTTIRNQLATANYDFPVSDGTANQVLITDGAGNLSFANVQSLDTNYNIQADTATGGANLTLVGSDATTDSVKFANGSNVTVVRTDANTITISSADTDTTYTQNASVATGGANLNLVGSDATTDTIKFAGGTNVTVVATDANTITIDAPDTNTTYTQNISATTGGANLNLVGSDATTDTVKFADGVGVTVVGTDANTATINIGQDVATTANPVFAGVTGGNITVGVADDQTITTTSGVLYINGAITTPGGVQVHLGDDADVLNYGFSSPTDPVLYTDHFVRGNLASRIYNTTNNGVVYPLRIEAEPGTAITPTTGYGVGMFATLYNAAGTNMTAGSLTYKWADATAGSEDTKTEVVLLRSGALALASSLDSSGNLTLSGGITVTGGIVGSSTFNAPGSGSILTYTLPGAAGAASTVLTNDGTGVLSWALPGGGGSTFGNITVAVVDNNTISTTTGDLVLDSATNLVNITAGLNVDSGVLYVDPTNNRVGINNTSPQYELHIDQGLDGITQIGMTTGERTTILTMNDGDDLLSLSYGVAPAPGPNRLQFSPTDQWFNIGNLGVGTNTPTETLDVVGNGKFSGDVTASTFTIDTRSTIDTTTLTTTSVATVSIVDTGRAVMKCVVSIVDNVTGERHVVEALVLEKGTTAYLTTYAEMYSSAALATFTADVSAGSLRLLVTPTSTNSTTFNVVRTSLT